MIEERGNRTSAVEWVRLAMSIIFTAALMAAMAGVL